VNKTSLLLWIGLLIIACVPSLQAQPSGTALRVNNEALTSTEVIGPIRQQLQQWAQQANQEQFLAKAEPLITQSVRNNLFNLLLYQHAQITFEDTETYNDALENVLAEKRKVLLAQYDGSEARAEEELARQGSSVQKELENVKRMVVIQGYQELNLAPTAEITRAQMLQYYRTHLKEKYRQQPKIQFQLIDIPVKKFLPEQARIRPTQEQWTQARQEAAQDAQDAYQQIRNGVDFAQVVEAFSHGYRKKYNGLWRPLDPEALQEQYKPVAKALMQIEPGQCTDIIEGDNRFFIAKLVELQHSRTIPFSEVQFEIMERLQQQAREAYWQKLQTELLEKASVGDIGRFIRETALAAYHQFNTKAQTLPDS